MIRHFKSSVCSSTKIPLYPNRNYLDQLKQVTHVSTEHTSLSQSSFTRSNSRNRQDHRTQFQIQDSYNFIPKRLDSSIFQNQKNNSSIKQQRSKSFDLSCIYPQQRKQQSITLEKKPFESFKEMFEKREKQGIFHEQLKQFFYNKIMKYSQLQLNSQIKICNQFKIQRLEQKKPKKRNESISSTKELIKQNAALKETCNIQSMRRTVSVQQKTIATQTIDQSNEKVMKPTLAQSNFLSRVQNKENLDKIDQSSKLNFLQQKMIKLKQQKLKMELQYNRIKDQGKMNYLNQLSQKLQKKNMNQNENEYTPWFQDQENEQIIPIKK